MASLDINIFFLKTKTHARMRTHAHKSARRYKRTTTTKLGIETEKNQIQHMSI